MKICYASQSFYPHIGGVSTYLLNLAKEMVERGNEVIEVHLRPSGGASREDIKGVEVHRVPREPIDRKLMLRYSRFKEAVYAECHHNEKRFSSPYHQMHGFLEFNRVNEFFGEEIREILRENPADIVHIHDFQLLFAYKYVPRGTSLILTWHIPFISNMSRELSHFLVRHMNEYDRVVFSSPDYIKAAVRAGLVKSKAELIYPICNTRLFRRLDINPEDIRRKYGIPVKSKIILSVQRVDVKSGHEQLIRAMPEVLKAVPDAALVFVGSHSMSNKLSKDRQVMAQRIRKLVRELKLSRKVLFLDNIDYHELPAVYNSVELVALCSRNEGFGLSITEAMSCGRPIVGTKVGGIPLQVKSGKNGFLVDVGDTETTAKRLVQLLSDEKLRQKMGIAAALVVKNKFSIESGIEKHAMLYNRLLWDKNELNRIEYLADIKGIVTDLDRTITDKPAGKFFKDSDFDRGLLEQMQASGTDLFLATGRDFRYVSALSKHFPIWRCIICENGAVLHFLRTKKTITIDTEDMARARRILAFFPGITIGKVLISFPWQQYQAITSKLGKLKNRLTITKNVDEGMILPIGVDKGLGVRVALSYLNIDLNKTIVIGDGENDIDMFLNPGFKIALSNAHPKLKRLAHQVTQNPSTKGVREILKKLNFQ
jgi:glycosyltransferase involved in cell wall biosynthesis/hydroxymethylpyrimidine pyrophosphatase-like HAD family hydrolase